MTRLTTGLFLGMVLLATTLISGCGDDRATIKAAKLAGEKIATEGRDGVPACMGCHGAEGQGVGNFPRLAALDPRYIERQLADYARDLPPAGVVLEPIAKDYVETPRIYSDLTVFTPGMRENTLMKGIAKALTAEERKQLAIYYSSLSFTTTPVEADFQTLERGQDLALRGKPEYGLPACISCHAPNGQGYGEHFPPLAGQPTQYLVDQINAWQTGKRDNDAMGLMKSIANQLTDADKYNAAAYYANRSYTWAGYKGEWPWPEKQQ